MLEWKLTRRPRDLLYSCEISSVGWFYNIDHNEQNTDKKNLYVPKEINYDPVVWRMSVAICFYNVIK